MFALFTCIAFSAETINLVDLDWTHSQSSHWKTVKNLACDGKPLVVDNIVRHNGIGNPCDLYHQVSPLRHI